MAEILGDGDFDDEGPCNRQRVQMSNASITENATWLPTQVRGTLQLEDIYREIFLHAYSISGGMDGVILDLKWPGGALAVVVLIFYFFSPASFFMPKSVSKWIGMWTR